MTKPLSSKRYRIPPDVIPHAIWLSFRFTLSRRDVEKLMTRGGIIFSREAIRCWVNKSGPVIAANLRRRRSHPTGRWRLDETKFGEARWSARLAAVECICGVLWTTRANCSTSWSRSVATGTRPCNYSAGC